MLLCDEVVAAMVFNFDVEKLADFGVDGDEDSAIDVGSIPHRAGDSFLFDQDTLAVAQLTLVDILCDFVDGR